MAKGRAKLIWLLAIILVVMVPFAMTACGNQEETAPENEEEENDEEVDNAKEDPGEHDAEFENDEAQELTEITLYFLEEQEDAFELGSETRTLEEAEPEKAVLYLIEGPESEDLDKLIPEGTELLGLEIDAQVAYLDLSEHVTQGVYGSKLELLLVESMVKTLVQFPDIDKVQFLVEGEIIDSIAGHVYTGDPIGEEGL